MKAAADLQPFGAFAGDAKADAVVDFQIVGKHQRAGAVDDIGEADGVVEHPFRRAAQLEAVGADQRPVDGQRMDDAELLKLAHERQVRIDIAVPAPDFHDPLRFVFALLLLHRSM